MPGTNYHTKIVSLSNKIPFLLKQKMGNLQNIPFQKESCSELIKKWECFDIFEKRLRSLIMIIYGSQFELELICNNIYIDEFKFCNKSLYLISFGQLSGIHCFIFRISEKDIYFVLENRTKKINVNDVLYVNEFIETRNKYQQKEESNVKSDIIRIIQ